jgi:hypothetical protein
VFSKLIDTKNRQYKIYKNMENEKNITKILNDLYEIDPELRNKKKELINIINKLIKLRPDIKIDDDFAFKLRKELLESENNRFNSIPEIINNFMKIKFIYGAGAFAIIVLAIVGIVGMDKIRNIASNPGEISFIPKEQKAFGSLASIGGNEGAEALGSRSLTAEVDGLGSGSEQSEDMVVGFGGSGLGAGSSDSANSKMIMPPYEYKNYTYKYEGEEINIEDNFLAVYKKVKSINTKDFSGIINNFDLGLFDSSKFQNLKIDNINLNEDREFGYGIYFNFKEGIVSINENWEKWPRPENECGLIKDLEENQRCYNSLRLKISDVPADNEIISIADSFIEHYKIDISNYGEATIDNNWKRSYESTPNKENAYVPEIIQVIYPLIINNKTVYDQSGNPSGLNVSVNIRHRKVSGVYSISSIKLESSDYEIENNTEKILEFAENGGIYNYHYAYNDSSTEELKLDTPKAVLLKHYLYENNESHELYVPALVFPIKNLPENSYFYRNSIVVPLEKEMFEEFNKNFEDKIPGEPRPMPLLEEPVIMEDMDVKILEREE